MVPRLRVLIAAFDGLLPTQITTPTTPTIHALITRGAVLHAEFALPDRLYPAMIAQLGPWPPKRAPELARITRVGDALLEYLIPQVDPDVALVWFPEPDTSQHASGVGSVTAREALT